jgi:hypothetical protein
MIALCAGCSVRTSGNVGGGGTPTTQPSVQVQGGSGFATLFGLAILGVMAYDYEVNGVRYRGNPFITVTDNVPQAAPELAPERKVNEQDCTKPIADWSANLKCR